MPHKDPQKRREYYARYKEINKEKISEYHKKRYERDGDKIRERSRKWLEQNRDKAKERSKKYYWDNREEQLMKKRRYNRENREFLNKKDREEYRTPKVLNQILIRNFGMTLDQYNAMNEAQGGLCAICRRPPITKASRLSVDHCHETGKIRGLLCTRCNTGIGMLNDSIEYVESALLYLVSHKNVLANV